MSRKAAILGLGERGSAWAEMFRDAGWRVSGFDPDPSVDGLPSGSRGWRKQETISSTVAYADWVVCCLPDRLELMLKVLQRAQAEAPDITETEVREALGRLDPLWDEFFPAEQARIVRLLVERVTVSDAGAEIKLNLEGLAGLARELGIPSSDKRRAA